VSNWGSREVTGTGARRRRGDWRLSAGVIGLSVPVCWCLDAGVMASRCRPRCCRDSVRRPRDSRRQVL